MTNTQRFNLFEFEKIIEEDDIPGNFTSVRGAYFIPEINEIGYYKSNGCMIGAENDEDLREVLSSKILEVIEIPHADIVPIYDEVNKQNGCMSINILKDNEDFIETESKYKEIITVKDFIESDIEEIAQIPNIPSKVLEDRRKYIAQYLYASALLSNTDIKMDNRQIIYNKKTGEYRNAEYYDAGIAFLSGEDRFFFQGKDSEEILSELYKDYATEIFPLAKRTEEKLTNEKIDEIMSDSIYNEFDEQTKENIINSLNNRVNLITKYNHNIIEYGVAKPNEITVNEINECTKDVDITLKDKVANFISNIKNKIIEKDKRDDSSR